MPTPIRTNAIQQNDFTANRGKHVPPLFQVVFNATFIYCIFISFPQMPPSCSPTLNTRYINAYKKFPIASSNSRNQQPPNEYIPHEISVPSSSYQNSSFAMVSIC